MEKLQPKLRFPEFDGNWEIKKIEEIFSIFNGYAFPSNASETEGVLWVKIADVGIQKMKFDNLSYLPISFSEKHRKFKLSKGDYVIALTRPILDGKLKIAQINKFFDGALLNQRVGKLISNNCLPFVYSLLQRDELIKSIENNIAGSDPPNLSPNEINSIEVNVPNIQEQQKIASFLTAVDDKISQLTRKKTLLEKYKKGVMQKIFNQDIRFKADNGNEFPEWEEKTLSEISNKPKYGLNSSAKEYDGINGYIRITDIDEQSRCFLRDKITSPEGFDDSYLVSSNDLLFTRTGASTGKSYLYNENDGKLYFAGFLIKFHISKANSKFVFYQTLLSKYDKWVKTMSMRSGQPGINAEEYSSLPLLLPCLQEQTKIANFLSAIDDKINQVAAQLEKTTVFKKGLLQQMFC
ncbi:MAG: restriction endonuclease subunit S [Flavobacterium sp.]